MELHVSFDLLCYIYMRNFFCKFVANFFPLDPREKSGSLLTKEKSIGFTFVKIRCNGNGHPDNLHNNAIAFF